MKFTPRAQRSVVILFLTGTDRCWNTVRAESEAVDPSTSATSEDKDNEPFNVKKPTGNDVPETLEGPNEFIVSENLTIDLITNSSSTTSESQSDTNLNAKPTDNNDSEILVNESDNEVEDSEGPNDFVFAPIFYDIPTIIIDESDNEVIDSVFSSSNTVEVSNYADATPLLVGGAEFLTPISFDEAEGGPTSEMADPSAFGVAGLPEDSISLNEMYNYDSPDAATSDFGELRASEEVTFVPDTITDSKEYAELLRLRYGKGNGKVSVTINEDTTPTASPTEPHVGRALKLEPEAVATMNSRALTDFSKYTCVGDKLSAGTHLLPTQYICDTEDEGNRFGLSFFGMPTFYKDGVLIWWKDHAGTKMTFQESDGHLILHARGPNSNPLWSNDCYDDKVGGDILQFVEGGVKIYDKNAVQMWGLDAAAVESGCYPYGKTQTMNRASNPFVCTGKAISADSHLVRHEFLCDPVNNGNRFGLNVNGYMELWRNGDLVWASEERGHQLWFSYDDAELVLREEGKIVWRSGCKSETPGKKTKFTPSGVRVLDRDKVLVWALTSDGFESSCFPEGELDDDDGDDDNNNLSLPDECKGYSLDVNDALKPNEYLCDPLDPSVRFGLSFIGMPQLLRGDTIVWFAPARGERLIYQDDGHLVLYGEGMVKWSTTCYGRTRGRQVDFVGGSINVIDQDFNSVWRLDKQGVGSLCYPEI